MTRTRDARLIVGRHQRFHRGIGANRVFTRLTKIQRFGSDHLPNVEVSELKLTTIIDQMSSWGIPPIAAFRAWGMFLSVTTTAAALAAGRGLTRGGDQSPVVGPVIRVENSGHLEQAMLPRKCRPGTLQSMSKIGPTEYSLGRHAVTLEQSLKSADMEVGSIISLLSQPRLGSYQTAGQR